MLQLRCVDSYPRFALPGCGSAHSWLFAAHRVGFHVGSPPQFTRLPVCTHPTFFGWFGSVYRLRVPVWFQLILGLRTLLVTRPGRGCYSLQRALRLRSSSRLRWLLPLYATHTCALNVWFTVTHAWLFVTLRLPFTTRCTFTRLRFRAFRLPFSFTFTVTFDCYVCCCCYVLRLPHYVCVTVCVAAFRTFAFVATVCYVWFYTFTLPVVCRWFTRCCYLYYVCISRTFSTTFPILHHDWTRVTLCLDSHIFSLIWFVYVLAFIWLVTFSWLLLPVTFARSVCSWLHLTRSSCCDSLILRLRWFTFCSFYCVCSRTHSYTFDCIYVTLRVLVTDLRRWTFTFVTVFAFLIFQLHITRYPHVRPVGFAVLRSFCGLRYTLIYVRSPFTRLHTARLRLIALVVTFYRSAHFVHLYVYAFSRCGFVGIVYDWFLIPGFAVCSVRFRVTFDSFVLPFRSVTLVITFPVPTLPDVAAVVASSLRLVNVLHTFGCSRFATHRLVLCVARLRSGSSC